MLSLASISAWRSGFAALYRRYFWFCAPETVLFILALLNDGFSRSFLEASEGTALIYALPVFIVVVLGRLVFCPVRNIRVRLLGCGDGLKGHDLVNALDDRYRRFRIAGYSICVWIFVSPLLQSTLVDWCNGVHQGVDSFDYRVFSYVRQCHWWHHFCGALFISHLVLTVWLIVVASLRPMELRLNVSVLLFFVPTALWLAILKALHGTSLHSHLMLRSGVCF